MNYYLGADVSKGYADFIILNKNSEVEEKNFQLDDTFKGHKTLQGILDNLLKRSTKSIIYAGVESTGGFERNWVQLFEKLKDRMDIHHSILNPKGVKHHKEARLERISTDKTSAKSIASYLIAHREKVNYNQVHSTDSLKRMWKFLLILKKQQTQLLNQLSSLMYIAQPQILQYCNDHVYDWILRVLYKYPTASKLAKGNIEMLEKIPYVTKERAKKLIEDAKSSIGASQDKGTENTLKAIVNQILRLRVTIKEQTLFMINSYCFPEVNLLKSFKGISDLSAFGLMLEIGSIDRFSSVKALAAYFGLHPSFKESGDGSWKSRMSKQGRKESRRLLYNVALNSIKSNDYIKDLYKGYLEKGKSKMSSVGIIMHKILRIIFGMLKNQTVFNPEIDKKNKIDKKRKNLNNNNSEVCKVDRRYQKYDQDAPISRIQSKKRNQLENIQEKNVKY